MGKIKNWKKHTLRYGIEWYNKVTKKKVLMGYDFKEKCWTVIKPGQTLDFETRDHAIKNAIRYMKSHTGRKK